MLDKRTSEIKNMNYNEMMRILDDVNEANQEMSKFEYI